MVSEVASATLVRDVAVRVGVPEEELVHDSIAAYLREKKRLLLMERFEILSRHGAESAEQIKEWIEAGQIHDHPAWEDYIELANIADEVERVEDALESVEQSE